MSPLRAGNVDGWETNCELTRVEQGPEKGGEDGGSWGEDGNEGGLEDLVAVEGEIPEEPASAGGHQPVPVPADQCKSGQLPSLVLEFTRSPASGASLKHIQRSLSSALELPNGRWSLTLSRENCLSLCMAMRHGLLCVRSDEIF